MSFVAKKGGKFVNHTKKKSMTNWTCPAIDHGVAIFPDQKIRPCCQASAEYSKPLSFISDPGRFSDLKNTIRPAACKKCWEAEDYGRQSYRQSFLQYKDRCKNGINFLDFRHSNQCNLKCRYCNPHFSNQWAKELEYNNTLIQSNFWTHADLLITGDLQDIYWCGGEPLIMKDHYDFLQEIIRRGFAKNIGLRYNSNLTQINYKGIDFSEIWKHFKKVSIAVSLDAAGIEINSIRSGSIWQDIDNNIKNLLSIKNKISTTLELYLAPTVSMLNVWFLPKLFDYATKKDISVHLNILSGPDYLSLNAIPRKLQAQAIDCINSVRSMVADCDYNHMMSMLVRDDNEYLFLHAVRHILLLDKIRNENLFDSLPYRDLAIELTAKNHEYE
jgi:sulfatase maturation enzyme AslB (radical SAM superfamily)